MKLRKFFALILSLVMICLVIPVNVSADDPTEQTTICVSPSGSASGRGSESFPLDIYTAVESALPGQTILLAGGTYSLSSPLVIDRGINGTAGQLITLMGDPNNRPVLNIGGSSAGVVLAGDYWYLQGFDVTGSAEYSTAVHVSGSNNTLDQINTYSNGGTGIELSTYLPADSFGNWPSGNLILNCSSYGNADMGNEADGFAASLTVGNGNVFNGCIAHHNASDGFDISASNDIGTIGQVVIVNSVSYKNGYLQNNTPAGTGMGFKLGSADILGSHTLRNSIAFDNRGKGVTSGGSPNPVIQNVTSFNNESYNADFYVSLATSTDYSATGFLSYHNAYTGVREYIAPRGTQNITKFYNTTSYYWNEAQSNSVNSQLGEVNADWFESLIFNTVGRNADGTVNMNGFLKLTANAPTDTGARMSGNPSPVFQVDKPSVQPGVSPASLFFEKGESETLHISLGTDFSGADIISSNPDVASVSAASLSADGYVQVTAIAAGRANITVTFSGLSSPYSVDVPIIVAAPYTPTEYYPIPEIKNPALANDPAPANTPDGTTEFTSKSGITSSVTVTEDKGVTVEAGINESGSVNSESTAAAIKKAAEIAKANGDTSVTMAVPEGATGLSKSTVEKLIEAADGLKITLELTSVVDGEKVGNISVPINSETGQILTGLYFDTERIDTAQSYIEEHFDTDILGSFETAQKGGWGATATLRVGLDKLDFKADDGDKLYALIYDTKTKKWYQVSATIEDGNVVIKTKRSGIVTIVTEPIKK